MFCSLLSNFLSLVERQVNFYYGNRPALQIKALTTTRKIKFKNRQNKTVGSYSLPYFAYSITKFGYIHRKYFVLLQITAVRDQHFPHILLGEVL